MRIFPKKTPIFLLVILLLVAAYFFWRPSGNKNPFAKVNLQERPIPCSFIISSGTSDAVALVYNGEKWIVNETYDADMARISDLLFILPRLDFLNPIPKSMQQNIREKLYQQGICISLFNAKKAHEGTLYVMHEIGVGTVGAERDGTVFLLGVSGGDIDLSAGLSADPAFWYANRIFSFPSPSIKTVCVQHLLNITQSFCIYKKPDEKPRLTDLNSTADYTYDEDAMKRYLTYFTNVAADKMIEGGDVEKKALKIDLQHIIGVEDEDGKLCTIACVGLKLPDGNYDTDKFLLYHYEKNHWAIASWVNFDILLKNLDDLLVKNP